MKKETDQRGKFATIQIDKTSKVINWPAEAEKIFGWKKKEINKKFSEKLVTTKFRKHFLSELGEFINSKKTDQHFDIICSHKSGEEMNIEITFIHSGIQDNCFALIRYDGYLKQVEKELKESDLRYHTFIDQASDAVMITDSTGKFIDVNRKLCEMFGYKKHELIGDNVKRIIDPKNLEEVPIDFDVLMKGHSILRERRMMHKDGTIIQVEANIKMFPDGNMVAIARNITSRKKMELSLRESEFMFRKVTENQIIGVAWASPEGKILNSNDAFCRMLGQSPKQIKGKHFKDFTHPDDLKKEYELVEKISKGEIDYYQIEKRYKMRNGSYRWVELNLSAYRNNTGDVEFFVGIVQNIDERKHAQQELEKSETQLRELSSHLQKVREEERTNIAREIHDVLGHQLASLKMETTLLKNKLTIDNKFATDKINRINVIIDDTVKTVREISSQLRPGILDDLGLVDAIEWQSTEFEKRTGIKSRFSFNSDDRVFEKNLATAIFRVFQESLTNIVRHAKATLVKTTFEANDLGIMLTIQDNGDGFDEEEVKEKKTLGLIGMKERATMFGGNFRIESSKKAGTLVTVEIPYNAGIKEKVNSLGIRILIADDHNIVRRGIREFLSEEFPDSFIREVDTGNKLLQAAREDNWNIIISDVSMPGRNGIESLKQIKEEYPKLPVLILSMHPEDQYAIRAMRAGAAGYLTKEAAPEELVTAVKTILGGKRFITATIADKLAEIIEGGNTHNQLHEKLSDREFDVLKLIASGKTISEIAKKLSVSVTTVSTYRSRILEKMKLRTNAELTHYAIENKLA